MNFSLLFILFLTAICIVVGGNYGVTLNKQKIEDIDQNPIYVELSEKVKTGELKVDEELGITLVVGMRDAHIDAGNYLESIFGIFIYIGFFLICVILALVFVNIKLYKNHGNST